MIGVKTRHFKVHEQISLENLVPQDHFYRQLQAKLDLNFVYELVADKYCWWNGRPSLDPVVFFKLQLIMLFEGIRSERHLLEQTQVNLAFRWYLGYDLLEPLPDHSSLSKIRDRYGLEVFWRFFEAIVEQCIAAGLVWGQELHFDASMVVANANPERKTARFYWEAIQAHLEQQFDEAVPMPLRLVEKYDGNTPVGPPNAYQKKRDYQVNLTDPDASPTGLGVGYRLHYVVDGGKSRIIVGCLVTPSAVQDNAPMVDLAWWARFRWRLPLQRAVADQRYGTTQNILQLERQGITAYTPLVAVTLQNRKSKFFPTSMFTYDPVQDCYVCPQGQRLSYYSSNPANETHLYKTDAPICLACRLRKQCTQNKRGRHISHSFYKPILDRVAAYAHTQAFKKAMRKRQVWIEPKFGEVKQWHNGRRFRLRRLHKVNMEALMKASVQNIKQLLKPRSTAHPRSPQPPVALALRPPNNGFLPFSVLQCSLPHLLSSTLKYY